MSISQPRIFLVDVFTQDAFWGNPVAVIAGGTRLSPECMLRIARWTGMPETVFVLPRESRDHTDTETDYAGFKVSTDTPRVMASRAPSDPDGRAHHSG